VCQKVSGFLGAEGGDDALACCHAMAQSRRFGFARDGALARAGPPVMPWKPAAMRAQNAPMARMCLGVPQVPRWTSNSSNPPIATAIVAAPTSRHAARMPYGLVVPDVRDSDGS
jgi:hypothetical protein